MINLKDTLERAVEQINRPEFAEPTRWVFPAGSVTSAMWR